MYWHACSYDTGVDLVSNTGLTFHISEYAFKEPLSLEFVLIPLQNSDPPLDMYMHKPKGMCIHIYTKLSYS